MTEIGAICDNKEIEGIAEIRDESNKKGLRIVVICQKGIDPDTIAISYNQVALID